MRKKILAFVLSAVMALGTMTAVVVTANALDVYRYNVGDVDEYEDFIDGMTMVDVNLTAHDYIGAVTVGGLWYNEHERNNEEWFVIVVEDNVEEFVIHRSFTNQPVNFFIWPLVDGEKTYISGGKVIVGSYANYYDGANNFYEGLDRSVIMTATAEDPVILRVSVDRRGGWLDNGHIYQVYHYLPGAGTVNYDTVYDAGGQYFWVYSRYLIFTQSQVAEFQSTGNLPPAALDWNGNEVAGVTERLDLTGLKALLSAYNVGDIPIASTQTEAAQPTVQQTVSNVVTDITVLYNGVNVDFTQPPVERNGYVFYALEDLFTAFSGGHSWDGETFTVSGELNGNRVSIPLRNLAYWVNGVLLDAPVELAPFVDSERTYVYLDFIVEGLGLSVSWNGDTRTISITN